MRAKSKCGHSVVEESLDVVEGSMAALCSGKIVENSRMANVIVIEGHDHFGMAAAKGLGYLLFEF